MLKLLVPLAIVLAPLTAAAGDSVHQACVGFASVDAGGGMKKLRRLAVRYDEQRTGPGSTDRKTELHAAALGHPYAGTAKSDGNVAFPIKLASGSDVLFDGTLEVLQDEGLALTGSYKLDGKPAKLVAVLQCTDI